MGRGGGPHRHRPCGLLQRRCLGDQWPGSRAIAIAKANTANAFSLPKFAFSTANLYFGAQPGGFLFGILETNPVDPATMYAGEAAAYGTASDPWLARRPAVR